MPSTDPRARLRKVPVDLRRTPLKAPSIVLPSHGEEMLRCGNCGGVKFTVHVKGGSNDAHMSSLVCDMCLKIRRVFRGLIAGERIGPD